MKKQNAEKLIKQEKLMEILGEIFKAPFQLLEKLTEYNDVFAIGKGPSEFTIEQEPPIKMDERSEIIPIDGYLGMYDPQLREITIFNKGIRNASEIIDCIPDDLTYIVRLHEWSHALIHIGLDKDGRLKAVRDDTYWIDLLEKLTSIFLSIETTLHEHLAQLLTYHALSELYQDAEHEEAKDVISRIMTTFQELNKRQPPEYIVDDYLEVAKARIIESISLLKREWLKGSFEAWSTVVKW
jgi:hypothetical protein